MTTPQQQPETVQSTGHTGSSAENIDATRSAGSGTDAPYATEQTGSSTPDVDAARTTGSTADVDAVRPTGPSADGPVAREGTETTGSAADSSTIEADSSGRPTDTSARHTDTAAAESLFDEHDLSNLRSRWTDVQASFVDEPRECVQKADALVADVVERLTSGFADARSRLEAHWAQGEEASTENLRVALKRYRDFFERLLAI